MSWAEVKKINSDMSTPININNLLWYVELAGGSYDGFNDISTLEQAIASPVLYTHKIGLNVVGYQFWDYVMKMPSGAGQLLTRAFKINSPAMDGCNTFMSLIANSDAVWDAGSSARLVISAIQNTTAYDFLLSNGMFVRSILNNFDAINYIFSNADDPLTLPVGRINSSTNAYSNINKSITTLGTVGTGQVYTAGSNATNILAVAVGGGGAGGGGTYTAYAGGKGGNINGSPGLICLTNDYVGGGGGSGGMMYGWYKDVANKSFPYTVGAGGIGVAYYAGGNGGDSAFGSLPMKPVARDQRFTIAKIATNGTTNYGRYASYGIGGYGGGAGDSTANNGVGGTGDGIYGSGGGGKVGSGYYVVQTGGGGGYGGGGGGGTTSSSNSSRYTPGGNGGQGIIALYIGKRKADL